MNISPLITPSWATLYVGEKHYSEHKEFTEVDLVAAMAGFFHLLNRQLNMLCEAMQRPDALYPDAIELTRLAVMDAEKFVTCYSKHGENKNHAPVIYPSWATVPEKGTFTEADLVDSLTLLFGMLDAQLMMLTDAMENTDNVNGLELSRRMILDASAFLSSYLEYRTEHQTIETHNPIQATG